MSKLDDVLDAALEGPIVPSFTKIGYAARKRLFDWRDLDDYDLSGRVMAITGPTSGLGKAAVDQLARCGAALVLIARNPDKAESVKEEIRDSTGNESLAIVQADLADLDEVRRAAAEITSSHDRLDVLIHNAGSLFNERRTTPDGTELTVRVHVESPFLLTGLLLDLLTATEGSRVLTMSSGGMYSVGLSVAGLEMPESEYKGAEQYARAKRAQVTLNEMWAERVPEVRFHALHPGWADTPGVAESLPTFRRLVGPLLRDPAQGADTMVWLAADDGRPLETSGLFWHDRHPRPIHKLGRTRRTDTPQRRVELWRRVAESTGWDLSQ